MLCRVCSHHRREAQSHSLQTCSDSGSAALTVGSIVTGTSRSISCCSRRLPDSSWPHTFRSVLSCALLMFMGTGAPELPQRTRRGACPILRVLEAANVHRSCVHHRVHFRVDVQLCEGARGPCAQETSLHAQYNERLTRCSRASICQAAPHCTTAGAVSPVAQPGRS